jgi:hypothetical protein
MSHFWCALTIFIYTTTLVGTRYFLLLVLSTSASITFVVKNVKQSLYTPWRRLGERRYSSYSFTTSALNGGEWSASRPGRALPPGKGPPVPIVQEAGWAPEPVWTQRLEEKSSAPAGDRTPVVQPVVRHYTAWANPAPTFVVYLAKINFVGLQFRVNNGILF